MNTGDYIEVKTTKETFKGILLPESTNNYLVLKLNSGYNIGIDKKKVKSKKVLKKKATKREKKLKITRNKKLPTILILHTGGTIASKVDYKTGGVNPKTTPEELLNFFPELKKITNLKCKLISNIFSEDINFKHYNLLAKEIQKEANKVDGIIITQGTDTIHYTSAALSFILENLGIPILIVGSQRSSDRASSDAFINLISAAIFITKTDYAGVSVCMHENMNDSQNIIIPGLKVRKMHTSRRDAFTPINTTPIARINYEKKSVTKITKNYLKKDKTKKIKLKLLNPNLKIGIIKSHPNMYAEEFKPYQKFDGLILEGTGLAGNFPINSDGKPITFENKKIYNEIRQLAKKIPVIATSQCIFGRINMNVYTTGRKLQEAGVLGNMLDMTTETAFLKLAWLLSNKKDPKKLMGTDLKGEINLRIGDEFL